MKKASCNFACRIDKSLFFILLSIVVVVSCEEYKPSVTYIFIENVNTPTFVVPIETPHEGVTLLPPEDPTLISPVEHTETPTPPNLEVRANVDPICGNNGQLIKVNVNLKVSGGIPPYVVGGKEIDTSNPVMTLNSGSYNEFDIKSSDGQTVHMRVWAPSTCENATQERVINPPPSVLPPTNLPPTSLPPTDLPPTELPPTNPPPSTDSSPTSTPCLLPNGKPRPNC